MDPQLVAALIAAGVGILTLIGTLAAQYFGRRATRRETKETFSEQIREQREGLDKSLEEQRNQLDRTLAEQRTRTLNERFATAATQLGDDKPPTVRLAGVYAMAGLADGWEENRQICVDVLCGYLRMPYDLGPGEDAAAPADVLAFRASQEVRHTVIRVITGHLVNTAATSWQGLNYDFSGVVFDGGSFSDANFAGGKVDFSEAVFRSGEVDFTGAKFSSGSVGFGLATFSGANVHFQSVDFCGALVSFIRARFSGGQVRFDRARFSGGHVDFAGALYAGSKVSFFDARVSGNGVVGFRGAVFAGGEVNFVHAAIEGLLHFNGAEFTGGKVDFSHSTFSDCFVGFLLAKFSGSDVDFGGACFSGGRSTSSVTSPRPSSPVVWSTSAPSATGHGRPSSPGPSRHHCGTPLSHHASSSPRSKGVPRPRGPLLATSPIPRSRCCLSVQTTVNDSVVADRPRSRACTTCVIPPQSAGAAHWWRRL